MKRPDIEAGTWSLDQEHTKVGFVARHLVVTKVRGHFQEFDATIEIADDLTDSSVEATLDVTTITTGSVDRDAYLRSPSFLDVENHPTISFRSTEIGEGGGGWRVSGDLTIRDVTHPITLHALYDGSAVDPSGVKYVAFRARAVLTREDWGLTWVAPIEGGGWVVAKDVNLEIEGRLIHL